MPDVVLFDLGRTLIDYDARAEASEEAWSRDIEPDIREMLAAWREEELGGP